MSGDMQAARSAQASPHTEPPSRSETSSMTAVLPLVHCRHPFQTALRSHSFAHAPTLIPAFSLAPCFRTWVPTRGNHCAGPYHLVHVQGVSLITGIDLIVACCIGTLGADVLGAEEPSQLNARVSLRYGRVTSEG